MQRSLSSFHKNKNKITPHQAFSQESELFPYPSSCIHVTDTEIDAQDILFKLKKPADIVNRVLNLELYPSSMLLCTTPLYDKLGGL